MTPYFKEQLGCEGSMSQHDTLTLREALRSIQYEAASLADAQVIALQALNATYPARAALSATQPAQAAQGEPVRHVDPEEIDRKQLRDAMARFVEDNRVQQAAQGAPMSTAKNHHQWLERVSFWAASVAGHPDFESGPIHDAAREIEAEADQLRSILMAQPAQAAQGAGEVVAFRGPSKWTEEEIDDGYRGIRWVNQEGVHGRPSEEDYARDLQRRGIAFPTPAQPAPVVPEGWRLVPVEPTREMMDAMPGLPAIGAAGDMDLKNLGWSLKEIQNRHRWMGAIAATPTPPAQEAADARDAERLDYLQSRGATIDLVNYGYDQEGRMRLAFRVGGLHATVNADIRAAIDAALATHQQGGSK